MQTRSLRSAVFLATLALFVVTAQQGRAGNRISVASRQAVAELARRPIAFERNQGQAPAYVHYVSHTPTYTALFEANKVIFSLPDRGGQVPVKQGRQSGVRPPRILQMEFAEGSRQQIAVATGLLAGQSNYLHGNDARRWVAGVAHYSRLTYASVYPSIDVAYYGSGRTLEYDFLVAPQGNPGNIRLRFSGQSRLQIDADGNIVLHAGQGSLLLKRPLAYQESAVSTRHVDARFVKVSSREVSLKVGPYDHTSPLVIDPKLSYSTYLGGAEDEGIFGIAFDPEGNLYVAGETSSLNFPVEDPVQAKVGGSYDAFVSKFDRTGSQLLYSTYLGGSGYDHAVGIAVDASGSAYVAGITQSPDFPTAHALQAQLSGSADAFIARLSASGSSLIYSTYLGGAGDDQANGLAIDDAGNAYIAGQTQSLNFPVTTNALQPQCGGAALGFCSGDAFVAKYNPAGSQLLYSTYLGGSRSDNANSLTVDSQGTVYVVGQTESSDFPIRNAYQGALAGPANAFITKLSPSSRGLEYSTYLGGNSFDAAQDIAVDAALNMYVTGFTGSSNFPTARPFQKALAGQIDAFVTKVDAKGASLDYSTYLGGSQVDYPFRIAVDAAGGASITGFTYSKDYPVANALNPTYLGGVSDAFVSRLDATGSRLAFSSYLGGASDDYGYAIHTDLTGALWVGGSTSSRDLALSHPFQNQYGGGPYDAFLEKISRDPADALEVLRAGIGEFVLASQLSEASATPLEYETQLASEAVRAGDRILAGVALVAFEAVLLEDFERGSIPAPTALRLALAGYDILEQIY